MSVYSPTPAGLVRRLSRSESTPSGSLDRFIPQRRGSMGGSLTTTPVRDANPSPKTGYNSPGNEKVLFFSPRPRLNNDPVSALCSVFDDQTFCTPLQRPHRRTLPRSPDRVLDLPDINDEISGEFLDWSAGDELAVAQPGRRVYTWSSREGRARALIPPGETGPGECNITTVSWSPDGKILATGEQCGAIGLWDRSRGDRIERFADPQNLSEHFGNESVHSISWSRNGKVLYSGHRCGCITRHDTRSPSSRGTVTPRGSVTSRSTAGGRCVSQGPGPLYTSRLSPDGAYIAGGGDGTVRVWDLRTSRLFQTVHVPPASLPSALPGGGTASPGLGSAGQEEGVTGVRALAWCPWQTRVIAVGGPPEGVLSLYNTNTAELVTSTNTDAEICCMVWSEETRELVTGHGGEENAINLWKYPYLSHVGSLTAHKSRVLHLAISPDKLTLASSGSDESLMMWNCFKVSDKTRRRSYVESVGSPKCCSPLMRMMTIR